MPRVTREPGELATLMSQRLLKADVAHRAQADPLIAWASWHLNTARMGWDLFRLAEPHGDENLTGHPLHTVELAAENLIFRGVVSAMDLCAASVFRLTGEPLSRRQGARRCLVVRLQRTPTLGPRSSVPRGLASGL